MYGACVAFNIPRFLTDRIERIDCPGERTADPAWEGGSGTPEGGAAEDYPGAREEGAFTVYFRWPGYTHVRTNPQFERVYNWLYFTFGICLPCLFLVVSSVLLVRALGRAQTKLRQIRAGEVCQPLL